MSRSHEVPHAAAGILFQPIRALHWLATGPTGAAVGVEYLDDVSLSSCQGNDIFEQNKFTTGESPPLNNNNVELWKTLDIWATVAQSRRDDLKEGKVSFVIATNRPLRPNWIISDIVKAKDPVTAQTVADEMRKLTSSSDVVNLHRRKVLSLPDDVLAALIVSIESDAVKGNASAGDLLSSLPVPDGVDRELLFSSLLGWICSCLFCAWRDKHPAIIEKSKFSNHYFQLVTMLKPQVRELPAQAVIGSLKTSGAALDRTARYIRQLDIIEMQDCAENAMSAFLMESSERLRLSREGDLVEDDIRDRDFRLHKAWENQRRKSRLQHASDKIKWGQLTYLECVALREPYRTFVPIEPYMTEGAFHRLANLTPKQSELYLGWHPDFKEILKND